jgi:integrase
VLLRIVLATGLRPSELFALRWRCFDPEKRLLLIIESVYRGKLRPFTKTTDFDSGSHLVRVFLPAVLVRDLQAWRGENRGEAFMFPSKKGTPLTKENYQRRVLNALAKKAEISKLNFQILRRSVATHMQCLGSPQDIAGLLRHTRPQTAAEHYVQIIPESVRQAGERLAVAILG